MSFNAICENKILEKISGFTVSSVIQAVDMNAKEQYSKDNILWRKIWELEFWAFKEKIFYNIFLRKFCKHIFFHS